MSPKCKSLGKWGLVTIAFLLCSYRAEADVNGVPFGDIFDHYAESQSLNGLNGWSGDTSIVATNAVYYGDDGKSTYVPPEMILTNQTSPGTSTNIWVDFHLWAKAFSASAPDVDPNSFCQFYFDYGGYPVVLDGPTTNWVTVSNTLAGTSVTAANTGVWVRITTYFNFGKQKWSLFVNDQLVRDDIGFHRTDTQFNGFTAENEMFLDNFWVNTSRPDGTTSNSLAALTSDVDSDGMPDAWELDYFGEVAAILPHGDYDDDGRSNLEEYLVGSDPTVPDHASQILPYRQDFESSPTGVIASTWHGTTNTGTLIIQRSQYVEADGTRGLYLSNGMINVSFASEDATNVWIQVYAKPVFGESDSATVLAIDQAAAYHVASGGVLKAYSAGGWSNLAFTVPANTWLGFAAHLDYNERKWDLYVSTNGVYGDVMQRANKYGPLDFDTNSSATSLSNLIVELDAEAHMYMDAIAVSYGYDLLETTYSNVVAYDRIVGKTVSAARPPYDYGTIDSVTNTLDGQMGTDLKIGMNTNDIIYIASTNGWNQYTLDAFLTWQEGGPGIVASNLYVNKGTGMKSRKTSGRDTVVFYPFGEFSVMTKNIDVVGTNDATLAGWNYLVSPFNDARTANGAGTLGFEFGSNPDAGDRVYLGNNELVYYGDVQKWKNMSSISSNKLAPGESFWYYRKSGTSFTWEVQQ